MTQHPLQNWQMRIPLLILHVFSMLLTSCGQTPTALHLSSKYSADIISTATHQHWLVKKPSHQGNRQLHIYIEGDGTPWLTRYRIADDPTPKRPMMLELMAKDNHPSWYLGRPCYYNRREFGMHDAECNSTLWTSARYSRGVVDSMIAALRAAIAKNSLAFSSITLIGHSGGGTLALLMSERMPEVTQLVTIAANLDIDAWTSCHQFSPLSESLNPARVIQAPLSIPQLHFAGEKDLQVPPETVKPFLSRINQPLILMPKQHHLNWSEVWPYILNKIDAQMKNERTHSSYRLAKPSICKEI